MFVKFVLLVLITNGETNGIRHNNGNKIEGNIVGGQYAKIEVFSHAVFVHICALPKKDWCSFCGSSVLNQRLLITAAHCIDSLKKIAIDVRAGATDILKAKVLKDVLYYMHHESYTREDIFGDIGLLMLAEDLTLGKTIKRVFIKPSFSEGIKGHVAGWGSINEYHGRLTVLKSVKQIVWKIKDCMKYEMMVKGTICANTGKTSLNYPFQGDSGSGFVTDDHQLIGLVSYRADESIPDLITYTNVSYFSQWIEKSATMLYEHCNNNNTGTDISTQIKTEENEEHPVVWNRY